MTQVIDVGGVDHVARSSEQHNGRVDDVACLAVAEQNTHAPTELIVERYYFDPAQGAREVRLAATAAPHLPHHSPVGSRNPTSDTLSLENRVKLTIALLERNECTSVEDPTHAAPGVPRTTTARRRIASSAASISASVMFPCSAS